MIRNATDRGFLLAWGGRLAVVGLAAVLAVAPFDVRGAGKTGTKGAAAKKTGAKDAKTTDSAAGDEKDTAAKDEPAAAPETGAVKLPEQVYSTGYNGSYVELINFINAQIRQGWVDNGVRPTEPADDAEWVRRVHLDIVGHIPDLETVQKFIADKDKAKRSKLIDKLLDEDPSFVRNFTTIWTNNLIGRATPRDINRSALQKFLRDSFGKNRGWNEIVSDLLTAEGNSDQNGAANYLLSHLNEGAVPATAISAKLFLGMQVQCTQCHNHPFNEWKQNTFWEFNSFFKQARSRSRFANTTRRPAAMDVEYLSSSLRRDLRRRADLLRKAPHRSDGMLVAYPKDSTKPT